MGLVNEARCVSATPDGLAVNMPTDCLTKYGVSDISNGDRRNSGEVLVEMKSIDSRVSVSKLPKDNHVDQVNLAMGLVRDTVFEDGEVYAPNYALLVYVDASNYGVVHVFVVAFDAEGYRGQLLRAKSIMQAVGAGPAAVETLRPEGKIAGGGDCRYCAFSKRCLGYAALVPKTTQVPDKKVVKKIRQLAGSLRRAKDNVEKHEQAAKNIEANLKETLAEAKTKWLDIGDIKMNWTVSDGQDRFDTDAAKKKLIDLGCDLKDFVKRTKPSESLKVEYVSKLAN